MATRCARQWGGAAACHAHGAALRTYGCSAHSEARGEHDAEPTTPARPPQLDNLPPDVLQYVVACLAYGELACLAQCSRRLRYCCRAASQFWRPRAEAALAMLPAAQSTWQRLQSRAAELQHSPPGPLDWLRVCHIAQKAAAGPWQLDAALLGRLRCPYGVLIVFELTLLPTSAPPGGKDEADARRCGREGLTVIRFELDDRTVEVRVDATGRVWSPQQEWWQAPIVLTPERPQALALELSYLFTVPAWFLYPCVASAHVGGVLPAASTFFPSRRDACERPLAALPGVDADGGGGGGGGDEGLGRLVLGEHWGWALDLSRGFGSYVPDPRFLDDAALSATSSPSAKHGPLTALTLGPAPPCMQACPGEVPALPGRLLPTKRGGGGDAASSAAATSVMGGQAPGSGDRAPDARAATSLGQRRPPRGKATRRPGAAAVGRAAAAAAAAAATSSAAGRVSMCCKAHRDAVASAAGAGATDAPLCLSVIGPPTSDAAASTMRAAKEAQRRREGGGAGGCGLRVAVSAASVWQAPAEPSHRFRTGFLFSAEQAALTQALCAAGLLPAPSDDADAAAVAHAALRHA